MRVTFLGTGTSHGVPAIGCDCTVCRSSDPRDRRTRPSILLDFEAPGGAEAPILGERPGGRARQQSPTAAAVRYVLVDTSTDLRAQALALDIRRVDAILFTHSHADHVFGLDEVRRYNVLQRTRIGCYADDRTLSDLRRMFAYIFDSRPGSGGGVPQLSPFQVGWVFSLAGFEVVPVPIMHGSRQILGYRFGSFAYLTDCNGIPENSWPLLHGVRTLALDALRERPHPTHFSLDEALKVVERLGPDRAYFTHICHDLPHAATCARLPAGVELAYDGLVVDAT
jgi:phosphoribosyl 1,2-cyclic phosphate phosphodiesterase